MQQMKDDAYWADVEQEQGVQTLTVQKNFLTTKDNKQKALAADYQEQFALHKAKLDEEKAESNREAMRLKQIQKQEEAKERVRQQKLREQAAEQAKEFQARNDELLQRREKRIEEDLAAEALTMKQHEESERRMEERAAFVKRRREEKNRIREKLISEQSKKLAEIHARQQKSQSIAESEIAKREEAERKRKLAEQKRMAEERNKDYNEYLRTKDLKVTDQVDTPDWTNDDEEEARQYDQRMKALQRKKVMQDQMAQAAERREAERRERLENLRQPRNKDTMFFLKDNEW
ncbi:axoneme-associated protein mst101 [Tritrichomonas foetus]|uniref:Axoneme-associated protein mst101 n=1 Tax=Tritrichomonas foetus TaxID=1144522 RepID=A0A1J4JQA6_9EUKA|nr:axoneme-associated protein mst101 [Tritrichomonas foetus]|eukprot:OHT01343.1 axoneme-associated protein mst101 [Tritrichomonas foetus]